MEEFVTSGFSEKDKQLLSTKIELLMKLHKKQNIGVKSGLEDTISEVAPNANLSPITSNTIKYKIQKSHKLLKRVILSVIPFSALSITAYFVYPYPGNIIISLGCLIPLGIALMQEKKYHDRSKNN